MNQVHNMMTCKLPYLPTIWFQLKCDFGNTGCTDTASEILLLSFPKSYCNITPVMFCLTIIVHINIVNSLSVQMVKELNGSI